MGRARGGPQAATHRFAEVFGNLRSGRPETAAEIESEHCQARARSLAERLAVPLPADISPEARYLLGYAEVDIESGIGIVIDRSCDNREALTQELARVPAQTKSCRHFLLALAGRGCVERLELQRAANGKASLLPSGVEINIPLDKLNEDNLVEEFSDDLFDEAEAEGERCTLCGDRIAPGDARMHDGGFVGEECCWDESLAATD